MLPSLFHRLQIKLSKQNIVSFIKNRVLTCTALHTILSVALYVPLSRKNKTKIAMICLNSWPKNIDFFLSKAIRNIETDSPHKQIKLSYGAIIKTPSISGASTEKGIILLGFEHQLEKLSRFKELEELAKSYDILFMCTWQPPFSEALLKTHKRIPNSFFILPSSYEDYCSLLSSQLKYHSLPFYASSWVNAKAYSPQPKDIDIIIVANFSEYKRHYKLFEALKDLPKHLKVVLIGKPFGGRNADTLLNEAKAFGVKERFKLIVAPENAVVKDYLERSKLFLALSAREGSYVAATEAMFAGCAVAMYSNSIIGSKNYINQDTGFLITPSAPLAPQLEELIRLSPNLNPEKWAKQNISNLANLKRLNRHMEHQNKARDLPWNRNIQPFHIVNFTPKFDSNTVDKEVSSTYEELASKGLTFS